MNLILSDADISLIKAASAKVDTWHFNKYFVLTFCIIGFFIVCSKAIWDLATIGSVTIPAIQIVLSLTMMAGVLVWLRAHWGRTDKDLAIDMIYSKLLESA